MLVTKLDESYAHKDCSHPWSCRLKVVVLSGEVMASHTTNTDKTEPTNKPARMLAANVIFIASGLAHLSECHSLGLSSRAHTVMQGHMPTYMQLLHVM